jgi:hypothetical protein
LMERMELRSAVLVPGWFTSWWIMDGMSVRSVTRYLVCAH